MLPEGEWKMLQLPIFIQVDRRLGRGTARVTGKTEVKVVSHFLNKRGRNDELELIIYRPEVAVLRRKLPTTTQYLFLGA